jgi:hypothetical protein
LERLYARLPTPQARNQFWQVTHWLEHDYPASAEAAFCRREMAAHLVLDPPRAGQIFAVADPHQSPPAQVAVATKPMPTPEPVVPRAWRKLVLPSSRPTPKPAPPATHATPKPAQPVAHATPQPEPAIHATTPKPAAPVARATPKPEPAAHATPKPEPATHGTPKPAQRTTGSKPMPTATAEVTPPGGDVPRF